MASLGASEAACLEAIAATDTQGSVSVAALNAPEQTVLSGDREELAKIVAHCEARGIKASWLSVSHAFHSQHMDAMLDDFREVAGSLPYRRPSRAVLSNVSGRVAEPERGELVSAAYWVQHVRAAVRFADGIRTALRLGARTATLVYRRSEAEMPARAEEIRHARAEGVRFATLTSPVEFLADSRPGWLGAVRLQRMRLGEPDGSGRRRPLPIEGSEQTLPVDVAIVATGTTANPLVPGTTPDLLTRRGGYVEGVYRLNRTWDFGYRYDRLWADDTGPFASSFDPYRHSLEATWRNSEFSLVRLQLSREKPSADATDNAIVWSSVVSTTVRMRDYGDDEIAHYVASGLPLDKAGAYGIQDGDFRPVERIDGCYTNVVGLPLCEVRRALASVAPDRAWGRPDTEMLCEALRASAGVPGDHG